MPAYRNGFRHRRGFSMTYSQSPFAARFMRGGGLFHSALPLAALAVLAMLWLPGCNNKPRNVDAPPAVAPPPSFTGPAFLRGTVGSMTSLRSGTDQPLLVSGYGVVVFPPGTGTGSSEVPPFLRQRVINDMRKRGLGSARMRSQLPPSLHPFLSLSPERFLDSRDTTVVAVQGLIPPGATRGEKFDILVSAIDSQTTSLAGGTLWTVDLGIDGTNPNIEFTRPLAEAYGSIYVNPFDDRPEEERKDDFRRQGVVVLGGEVTAPRVVELVLNQPSWSRSRVIADRINERFGRSADRRPLANPQTDSRIQITIPRRWAHRPDMMLDLIAHLYVERGPGFEATKADEMASLLREQPNFAPPVVAVWRSLGRGALESLRTYYEDPEPHVRLASLEAGAWLGDERAARYLQPLAVDSDPHVRSRVAQALVYLPSSITGARTLRQLLDDADNGVRIAAYESLALINDTVILQRLPIGNGQDVKFMVDQVPSTRPMIYITQQSFPRIVLFGDDLRLPESTLARLWDNRLMLRTTTDAEPMEVFYQAPHRVEPRRHRVASPSLMMLAYVLGHSPHDRDLQPGLDLSYSQVVDAVYHLVRDGHVRADVEFRLSPLAQRVEELERLPARRPETTMELQPQGTIEELPGDFDTLPDEGGPSPLTARPRPDTAGQVAR
jgi:hypothetical protein